MYWPSALDERVTHWAAGHRVPALNHVAHLLRDAAGPLPLLAALVVAAVLAVRRRALIRPLVTGAVAAAIGEVTTELLKPLFARPRPDAHLALVTAVGYSFPSAAAATVFAGAVAVIYTSPPSGSPPRTAWVVVHALLLGLALLVGAAVIYLGVHWLSDVVAGALEGAVIGYAAARVATLRRVPRLG